MQGMFGGHLCVIDMVGKQLHKAYQEPWYLSGGLAFNTNDTMIATGNQNGEVTVRNLMHPEGNTVNRLLQNNPSEDVGTSEIKLQHFEKDPTLKCEVTQVKFSVVKRYILASAYQNG
jgi:hypothetical protein